MDHAQHYLSFLVGSQWYGISIENIIEVSYLVMLNELPVTERGVLGLMTIRDEVIPVIDMRLRFGITDFQFQLNTPIISVRTAHGTVGLVVDDVDNVENISADQHSDYKGAEFQHVKGVAQLEKNLLLLVDPDLL